MYVEHCSKNRSGGIAQMNMENKCVKYITIPENRPMCLVYLLDLYKALVHTQPSIVLHNYYPLDLLIAR